MRIAVDIDNVLADLHTRFLELVNKDFGTHYKYDDVTEWNTWDCLPVFKEMPNRAAAKALAWRYFDLAWLSPEKMPQVPGAWMAHFLLWSMRDTPVIDLVTSRRWESAPDVIRWLKLNDLTGYFRALVIMDAFSGRSKAALDYDLFIDDNPHLAKDIEAYPQKKLLLFDQPWNQHIDTGGESNVVRLPSWSALVVAPVYYLSLEGSK